MRLPLLMVPALLLAGCSTISSWFGSEKDPHPPVELQNPAPTGNITSVWQERVGKGMDEQQAKLVPALHEGRLYVADHQGRIEVRDARSGSLIWTKSTQLPFSGGPGVGEDLVLLGTSGGELVALSAADGEERWRAPLASEILSIPRIRTGIVIAYTLDGSVYALDAKSGARRWDYRRPTPVLTLRGMSSPVLAGRNVIVGFPDGKLVNLELETGAPLWELTITPPIGRTELERMVDIDADPVVVGSTIFVVTFQGDLAAINGPTASVVWRHPLSSYAGMAVDNRYIYVTDAKDHAWAIDIGSGGTVWKQHQFTYRHLTAPAVLGDSILVGDLEGYVHLLSAEDGSVLARKRLTKAPISQQPQVSDGVAYVYADDGTLAALTAGGAISVPESKATGSPARAETAPAVDAGQTASEEMKVKLESEAAEPR